MSALVHPRNCASSRIRSGVVPTLGLKRPSTRHPLSDRGDNHGSDVKRYRIPAAAADSSTWREMSPPGTDAVRHGAPTISPIASPLVRHSSSIRAGVRSGKMSGCVCECVPTTCPQLTR